MCERVVSEVSKETSDFQICFRHLGNTKIEKTLFGQSPAWDLFFACFNGPDPQQFGLVAHVGGTVPQRKKVRHRALWEQASN